MTTPEQLTKWREEFESFYSDDRECLLTRDANSGDYVNETVDSGWWGYLRAKKENEQAMKLAKFGAMVLSKFDYPDQEEIASELDLLRFDDRKQQYELAAGIEATIKELLND